MVLHPFIIIDQFESPVSLHIIVLGHAPFLLGLSNHFSCLLEIHSKPKNLLENAQSRLALPEALFSSWPPQFLPPFGPLIHHHHIFDDPNCLVLTSTRNQQVSHFCGP